ncbi:MAG: hypothetical protein KKC30_04555 [Proteobacteria bacterium]|nr:hypothetical protein [Pseudomonadota bacterium]MBU4384030.1 hypothetical protein [Pseudomonadota bacterium]MBU4605046.1 hypothetical protein [Pseudomonadota bacterium]MCG2763669.1 hypothetical protein [Desulfarculaceae bacterium]
MPFEAHRQSYLAVSMFYPPSAETRAVMVSRLLAALPQEWLIAHGASLYFRQDPSTAPGPQAGPREFFPLPAPGHAPLAARLAKRGVPLVQQRPDRYRAWIQPASRAITAWLVARPRPPRAVLGIGQPWSSLMTAAQVSRNTGLPLLAYFSDPWYDNLGLNHLPDPLSRALHRRWEAQVVEQAAKVMFPCQDLADLVMAKYPEKQRAKARIIPHSFDSARYPAFAPDPQGIKHVRFLGSFYQKLTPLPFLRGLARALEIAPNAFEQVRFQFIGPDSVYFQDAPELAALPSGLVSFLPPVAYQESLDLMAASHALLVIDPEIPTCPLLLSKLVDYLGANRPLCGVVTQGHTQRLLTELGGWSASYQNPQAIAEMLVRVAAAPSEPVPLDQTVRAAYAVREVATRFQAILDE